MRVEQSPLPQPLASEGPFEIITSLMPELLAIPGDSISLTVVNLKLMQFDPNQVANSRNSLKAENVQCGGGVKDPSPEETVFHAVEHRILERIGNHPARGCTLRWITLPRNQAIIAVSASGLSSQEIDKVVLETLAEANSLITDTTG